MTGSQPDNEAIFHAARDISNPERRREYVRDACGRDEARIAHIEALLAAADTRDSLLDCPAMSDAVPTTDQPTTSLGTVIGPYKLIEQIGEGGMGTVWMAQQSEPVKRLVALKLIKAGMDSRQVIARFEAERQALALMDHPNIARVLDGGSTSAGRPYFVMDLVRGVPITRYCDEHHLTPRQRLELFIPVCQAIQHAHQKGIIHRDLKPSNVLVALYDGQPVPKVIDFGVAKATGQPLTEQTLVTGFGNIVGTLEYMSPEQAEINQLDIDTRSDIYSLGVLLYELLAGSPPFTRKELEKAGMLEMLRVIREQEPSKPSTKLSTAEGLPTLAANRGTEPAKLTKLVRGELDWIVMKALEKDRSRRYETANGFAMDMQRYLADEAVLACPPSAGYRLKKFVRRNKAALVTASVIGVALLLAVASLGWAVRDRAVRQGRIGAQVDLILGEVEQFEKELKWPEALAVARRAEALTADGADAATQERVRQVLHDLQMVARLEELGLLEQYVVYERGKDAINEGRPDLYAAAFRDFGVDVEALPAEDAAARLRARPAVAVALAAGLDDWAGRVSRRDPDQYNRLKALASAVDPDPWRVSVRRAAAAKDVDALVKLANDPDTARRPPHSQNLLAVALRGRGQPEQALALLERACEIHPGDFWIHFGLASANREVRPARLEAAVRHGIAARALRPRHTGTWNNLGLALYDQKKLDEAIACYLKAIELDPKHATAHMNLGLARYDQRKLDEAIACYKKAIDLDPRYLGPYHNLGNALRRQHKLDEAIACYLKAIDLDPKYAALYNSLGDALHAQNRLDDAIAAYQKAIDVEPKCFPAHTGLGNVWIAQKNWEEAVGAYQRGLEITRADAATHSNITFAELDRRYSSVHYNIGFARHKQNRLDEAVAAYRKAIELDSNDAAFYNNLGNALTELKKLDDAIAAYRKAIELNPKDAAAYHSLGNALWAQGKVDEAVAAFRQAIELNPKDHSAHNNLGCLLCDYLRDFGNAIECFCKAIELEPKNANNYVNLGNALRGLKKLDEAIAAYRKAIELDVNYVSAHIGLGAALCEQKKFDEAIGAYHKAIELEPKNAGAQYGLGNALYGQNKLDDAVAAYRKAIELDPKNANSHYALGLALRALNKLDEAIAAFRKTIELDPKNVAARNNLASTLNKLAWALATHAEPVRRDPARVVSLAKEAVELKPQEGTYHNTLGTALYRAGDWKNAIVALEESMELRKGGNGFDWFFLAMAHWQLGEKDKARAWYDRAVEWMDKNQPMNEELRRFRAEAAELLELKEKK